MDRQVPLGTAIATVLALLLSAPEGASAQIAVSANDNKVLLVDGERTVPRNPEPDTVTIIDLNGPKPEVIGEVQASSRSGLSDVDRRDCPETPLDRSIERQDDRIENSICSGC